MVGTVEKGVDTFIATDMIRLAWENAYEIAVLASSDSDLVPAEVSGPKSEKSCAGRISPGRSGSRDGLLGLV